MAANLTQILNFKANFHPEFELFSKKKIMLTMVDTLTLSDPGYFRQLTIRGGGGFKSPPLRSRKLLCQSSPYHTCEFYQVFLACSNWNFSKIRDFDHFTAISK